jgi:predicted regulator of Ras-like GTPase activity (Roadblock/LC7/MglB family)
VDTSSALADLSEISSQIEAAVVFDQGGAVLGSTVPDEARSQRLARTALELISAAEQAGTSGRRLTQIEASLREGSVFVVSTEGRGIAATTTAEPTSGLIFYDLRTCLRSLEDDPAAQAQPKPSRRKTKEAQDA